jgi:hypothetical protein
MNGHQERRTTMKRMKRSILQWLAQRSPHCFTHFNFYLMEGLRFAMLCFARLNFFSHISLNWPDLFTAFAWLTMRRCLFLPLNQWCSAFRDERYYMLMRCIPLKLCEPNALDAAMSNNNNPHKISLWHFASYDMTAALCPLPAR